VIGSAIFAAPAAVAAMTGAWSPLAALIAGLGFLAIILCFAEVASRFREGGGPYLYAHEAYGSLVGFEVGWLTYWTRVLSGAANLNVFVLYFAALVPLAGTTGGRAATMLLVVGVVTVINVLGVRQATCTVAKLLPLFFLIALGLPQVQREVLATQLVATPNWTEAVLLLVFAYGGFEAALIPAGEARDPRRDTGFALLTALAVIATVYMLVQLVVVGVVPRAALAKAPIADAFGILLGPAGVVFASVAAMLSVYGWTMGNVLASPRVLFSMAERGALPAFLARVHPRFQTPHVAIVVYAACVLALALGGTFVGNAVLAAIVRLVYYALTCAALPIFRRRNLEPPGFRLPGAAWVAPLALIFCGYLLSTRTFTQAWVLLALILAGLPLFWAARRKSAPVSA
jgi:amino acid transporter